MNKNKTIKYQDVVRLCTKLEQSGHQVSLRGIQAGLGGSFSAIGSLIQHWRKERSHMRAQHEIFSALQEDSLTGTHVENLNLVALKEQLFWERELSQEVLEVLSLTEKNAEGVLSKIAKLEQALAIVRDRLREAQKKAHTVDRSYHKAIREAEAAKTESKQLKARFSKAKERITEMYSTIRHLEQTACDAKLRAVKAEGRLLDILTSHKV